MQKIGSTVSRRITPWVSGSDDRKMMYDAVVLEDKRRRPEK